MMTGETSFSNAVRGAMLCLALFAALLGQNFGHNAAEAAAEVSIGVAPGSGTPTGGDDVVSARTNVDCCDNCGQPVAPLRVALAFCPMRPVQATAFPECGCGASLPHPDKPPRA
jgi:hypothetical protein